MLLALVGWLGYRSNSLLDRHVLWFACICWPTAWATASKPLYLRKQTVAPLLAAGGALWVQGRQPHPTGCLPQGPRRHQLCHCGHQRQRQVHCAAAAVQVGRAPGGRDGGKGQSTGGKGSGAAAVPVPCWRSCFPGPLTTTPSCRPACCSHTFPTYHVSHAHVVLSAYCCCYHVSCPCHCPMGPLQSY
jgi:hypothetical protein